MFETEIMIILFAVPYDEIYGYLWKYIVVQQMLAKFTLNHLHEDETWRYIIIYINIGLFIFGMAFLLFGERMRYS